MITRKIRQLFEVISILCLLVSLAVVLSGCTATRHTVQKTVVPMLDTSVDDLVDKLMRQKNGAFVKDGLPGALLVVTGLTELAPTNYNLLATTSFLYAVYGLFVEDGNEDYAISLYKVGTDYGLRAMKVNNSKFRKAVESGTPVYDAAKFLTKDDLKALTWYGVNLAKRVTLQLEANWAILGVFYAVVPAYGGMGGGADGSREAFANGNKVENGEFGFMDVMMARYYCPLIKDRVLYDQLNNRVIEMDPCKLGGGLCIVNELAKQKARYNMENKVRYLDYF
jgi:phage gpG-like protein